MHGLHSGHEEDFMASFQWFCQNLTQITNRMLSSLRVLAILLDLAYTFAIT